MKIILASKSGVRKKILDKYNIDSEVVVSNVDEDQIKESLLAEKATPLIISKNLAEVKSKKVSNKHPDYLVLGADSVISLDNKLINKPKSRKEALDILKELNNSKHYLISSVCISKIFKIDAAVSSTDLLVTSIIGQLYLLKSFLDLSNSSFIELRSVYSLIL